MDFGPLITQQHLNNVTNYITTGVEEGATLIVDGRGKKPVGHENGFFIGGSLFDNVTSDMVIYKRRDLWTCYWVSSEQKALKKQ